MSPGAGAHIVFSAGDPKFEVTPLGGVTQIPWQADKLPAWDVTLTVISSLARPSDWYLATAARGVGEVAELAATRKCDKYADIPGAYSFFCRLPSTHMVSWTPQLMTSFMRLVAESAKSPAMIEKSLSFFSDFQCWFSGSTQLCCHSLLPCMMHDDSDLWPYQVFTLLLLFVS